MRVFIRFIVICCLLTATQLSAFEGKVVKVSDGDTVEVLSADEKLTTIRLYGIDCPEKKQSFGQKAKQFVLDMAANKTVEVETIDVDRYGRTVGVVHIGNINLNSEILRAGLAWHYAQYCKKAFCSEWQQIEQQARAGKIGLWVEPNPVNPSDFRRGNKESNIDKKTVGNFSGNVSSKKFHKQGCKHFNCKSCTVYFNSIYEAVSAGYEPCGLCKP